MSRSLKRTFAVAALIMALAAISAPLAQARFQVDPPRGSAVGTSQPVRVTHEASSSFSWGDAAIGATVMLAAISLGTGVVLLGRRTRSQAAVS